MESANKDIFHAFILTIAWYSAAISSELGKATACGRGGIAGRWTKPVAAFPVSGVPSNAESLARTRLGELYPGSTDRPAGCSPNVAKNFWWRVMKPLPKDAWSNLEAQACHPVE